MSQHAVGFVIQRLLTDRDFRDRFAEDPLEALAYLHLWTDVELTPNEIGAFVRSDPDVWSSRGRLPGARVH